MKQEQAWPWPEKDAKVALDALHRVRESVSFWAPDDSYAEFIRVNLTIIIDLMEGWPGKGTD